MDWAFNLDDIQDKLSHVAGSFISGGHEVGYDVWLGKFGQGVIVERGGSRIPVNFLDLLWFGSDACSYSVLGSFDCCGNFTELVNRFLKPVGGQNAVNDPAMIFQHRLPQPVPVTGGP